MRAFSALSHSLLQDRSISWCAVGVLAYLLTLPHGTHVTVRALAKRGKEDRGRIARALRELEESRYLRRVVRGGRWWGQLRADYEVFDTPYEDEPPTGEPEKVRNPTSGESAESAESGSSSQRTLIAARMLGSLALTHPCLTLGASQVWRLAPLVVEWWDAGVSSAQLRAVLTDELPRRVHSPGALVESRLRDHHPAGPTPA
ncbi:hypothetical protein I2W78_17530 [Streptomyces spinoverrucosus]|uniref:hypothetical protein n=1 Tax=Streptomyces spinoverrucosus TaxID=284043 RepID=UPI0018C37C3C|nr:hypothetical protein [Streptomyces spinoverrucosus]MBG0853598.1 hypothetical protein [Streptomyces spinoverrucosus]